MNNETIKEMHSPAFPSGDDEEGLTKREYFAALVMQGVCSIEAIESIPDAARWSVQAADALLEELNK